MLKARIAGCLLGLAIATPASAATYNLTILSPLAGALNASPKGINDAGQVIGVSIFPAPLNPITLGTGQATIWNAGLPSLLPSLPGGTGASPVAINNAGQVAGLSWSAAEGLSAQPVVWNGTTATPLSTPGGPSWAGAINNAGQVVGSVTVNGNNQAAVWNGTTPTLLASPGGGGGSFATAINNAGQIVGNIGGAPVLWNAAAPAAAPAALGVPTGATSTTAAAINNAGQAVGTAFSGEFGEIRTAVIWNGTSPTVLGSLGGTSSWALAINDAGLVVGASSPVDSLPHGTIWDGTTAIDINTLLASDPLIIGALTGINSIGQIIGSAYGDNGEGYAVLLTPVAQTPLPAALPLFASGLGALWFAARRRRTQTASAPQRA